MCKECGCQSSQDCCCDAGRDGCDCDGHGSHSFKRRYQTKVEQIAELEAYLSELKTEVQQWKNTWSICDSKLVSVQEKSRNYGCALEIHAAVRTYFLGIVDISSCEEIL